jgi:hypothetical protein
MNLIWRFYSDNDKKWRWQRLAFDGSVVAESPTGYKEYEACQANAQAQGYVFLPAQSTRPETSPTKQRRSYVRLSSY